MRQSTQKLRKKNGVTAVERVRGAYDNALNELNAWAADEELTNNERDTIRQALLDKRQRLDNEGFDFERRYPIFDCPKLYLDSRLNDALVVRANLIIRTRGLLPSCWEQLDEFDRAPDRLSEGLPAGEVAGYYRDKKSGSFYRCNGRPVDRLFADRATLARHLYSVAGIRVEDNCIIKSTRPARSGETGDNHGMVEDTHLLVGDHYEANYRAGAVRDTLATGGCMGAEHIVFDALLKNLSVIGGRPGGLVLRDRNISTQEQEAMKSGMT